MRSLTDGMERCGRGALRLTALLTLVIGLLALPPMASAATGGGLKPLAANPCLSDDASPPSGCTDVRGMQGIGKIAVSPQGDTVYVPSRTKDAIAAFARNPSTGALSQMSSITGCYTSDNSVSTSDTCSLASLDTASLDGPTAVAVSPDGKSVYLVTQSGRLTALNRDDDGTLSFNQVINMTGGGAPTSELNSVVVSPDGASIYVAGPAYNGIVWSLFRNRTAGATLGDMSLDACYAVSACSPVNGLHAVRDLAVTPDNKQLIVAAGDFTTCCNWATLGFDRLASGPTPGTLTVPTTASRCVTAQSALANCQLRSGSFWPRALALADNGSRIYVGGNETLSTINRDPATNALTAVTAGNCVTYTGAGYPGCTELPQSCSNVCTQSSVLVPPDGASLYLSANGGTPTVFAFNRGANGSFSPQPSPFNCLSPAGNGNCSALANGGHVESLAADKDSRNVYAAGANRLFSFAIDRAPTCQNASASTAHNTSVAVTLSCSDPDGDVLIYEKVGDPARGTLGGVQGSTINYNPLTGTSGVDSFTYRAVAAGAVSDPATATVNVAGPTAPPPPQPTLIPSTVSNNWAASARFTQVITLSAKRLPAGAKVVVACKTKSKRLQKSRCPYKSKTFRAPAGKAQVNLAKQFRKKKLPLGTTIKITITAPNFIGKVFTYTIRKRRIPSLKLQCLAPGSTTKSVKCS